MDPVADIGVNPTNEEIIVHLEKMLTGSPAPSNVMTDVNPYKYHPSYLPDGIWYLICSEEKAADNEHGLWLAEGEASEIFSNSLIIGWMTTLQFYEGQVPHQHKTDWLMEEFSITEKIPTENMAKEAGSLCRVFHCSGRQSPNAENQQRMSSDEETWELALMEILQNHHVENPPEIDYPFEDTYLELLDLYNPLSPSSSSSESSSCLTMSSVEDSNLLALLREQESENNQDLDMSPETSERFLVGPDLNRPHYRDEGSSSNTNNLATSSQCEPDIEEEGKRKKQKK